MIKTSVRGFVLSDTETVIYEVYPDSIYWDYYVFSKTAGQTVLVNRNSLKNNNMEAFDVISQAVLDHIEAEAKTAALFSDEVTRG